MGHIPTSTRLRYQVRLSCVLFALRLIKFPEIMKRKVFGTDNHAIPENTRATESHSLVQGELRTIRRQVLKGTHSERHRVQVPEFPPGHGVALCNYTLLWATGTLP